MTNAKQLRSFIKAREYKERSQLGSRKKLGLLEKKKDYKLRAVDYHKKTDALNKLRLKANLRNPDEYYEAMKKSKTVNGKHVVDKHTVRSKKELEDYKKQDLNYLTMNAQADRSKLDQMQASLHLLDEDNESTGRKHVIFKETDEEARNFDACKHFNTVPELLHRSHNRLKSDQLEKNVILNKKEVGLLEKADKQRKSAYNELSQRVERSDMIEQASKRLRMQQLLSHSKGKRRKIIVRDEFGDEIKSKTVYKWSTERKR